jgi:hypothetical protein
MRFEAKYARFENLNENNEYDAPMSNTAISNYNQDSNTITIQSKMNGNPEKDNDFDFGDNQEVPF